MNNVTVEDQLVAPISPEIKLCFCLFLRFDKKAKALLAYQNSFFFFFGLEDPLLLFFLFRTRPLSNQAKQEHEQPEILISFSYQKPVRT